MGIIVTFASKFIHIHPFMAGRDTDISEILKIQRDYFLSGATRQNEARKESLYTLKRVLKDHEQEIIEALHHDFGKSYFEAISNELGLVYAEISIALRKLRKWTTPERKSTSLLNLPGRSRIYPIPYGNVLVISPWNYPVQLAMMPVVSALAAGNTVILKPSEISAHTSGVLAKILNEAFPVRQLYVREGGPDETSELLGYRFDKIFFTGSTRVGKLVMRAAAENLTPVTLELGGKNPVIVMPDCDLKMTVKRLVWGKFHNGGQACVAPDHIYIHEEIHDRFVEALKSYIPKHFGGDPRDSRAYPRIINIVHYERLMRLIDYRKTIMGGKGDDALLYLEPTVMTDVSPDDEVMKEEIFGPILPLIRFNNLEKLLDQLHKQPSPKWGYTAFHRHSRTRKGYEMPCPFDEFNGFCQ